MEHKLELPKTYTVEQIKALEDVTLKSVGLGTETHRDVYLCLKRTEPGWIQVFGKKGLQCECQLYHIHDIVQYETEK